VRVAVRFITVLVLVLSLGLHWALLQTVAWTGMLISYSRTGSFSEAVAKTFDGQHPCCLCKTIKQGRDTEKQQEKSKPGSKVDQALVWEPLALDFFCPMERVVALEPAWSARGDDPPKPRPRSLLPDSSA
jgi:hypothetical protein